MSYYINRVIHQFESRLYFEFKLNRHCISIPIWAFLSEYRSRLCTFFLILTFLQCPMYVHIPIVGHNEESSLLNYNLDIDNMFTLSWVLKKVLCKLTVLKCIIESYFRLFKYLLLRNWLINLKHVILSFQDLSIIFLPIIWWVSHSYKYSSIIYNNLFTNRIKLIYNFMIRL